MLISETENIASKISIRIDINDSYKVVLSFPREQKKNCMKEIIESFTRYHKELDISAQGFAELIQNYLIGKGIEVKIYSNNKKDRIDYLINEKFMK